MEQNRPDGIGTFVHEFSHVLGLPDLYHTAALSGVEHEHIVYIAVAVAVVLGEIDRSV